MSEAEAFHYCPKCKKDTAHIFSGSLKKGSCLTCENNLPEDEEADFRRCYSYSG